MSKPTEHTFAAMDKLTNDWFEKAARNECGWFCPDCCMGFSDGMPDSCPHDLKDCTEIIQRDKARAALKKLEDV